VFGLVAEPGAPARDPPVAVPAGVVAPVELEVPTVSGVAPLAAPDLERCRRLAREDVDRPVERSIGGDAIGRVRAAGEVFGLEPLAAVPGVPFGEAPERGVALCVGAECLSAPEQVGVDEEVLDPLFGEELLDAPSATRFRDAWSPYGRCPVVGGSIRGLRQPDPARLTAEEAPGALDTESDLGTDHLVGAEEREVAVRRGAGDDLDRALVLESAECTDDVPVVAFAEVMEPLREDDRPVAGDVAAVGAPFPSEDLRVVASGLDPLLEPAFEFVLERFTRELLAEDRGDAERDPGPEPFLEEPLDPADQGEVAFRRRLVQPFGPVRPAAVREDVGEMGVQNEGECAEFHGTFPCWIVGGGLRFAPASTRP